MPDEPADAFDGRCARCHGQGVELGEAEAVHGAQQAFLRAAGGIKQHVEVGRGHGIVPDRGLRAGLYRALLRRACGRG